MTRTCLTLSSFLTWFCGCTTKLWTASRRLSSLRRPKILCALLSAPCDRKSVFIHQSCFYGAVNQSSNHTNSAHCLRSSIVFKPTCSSARPSVEKLQPTPHLVVRPCITTRTQRDMGHQDHSMRGLPNN